MDQMASPVVSATLQSACLGVASSLLAQAFTAYNAADDKQDISLTVDWLPVLQYLLYIIISTPPNFKWQQLLESSFPAYPNHDPHPGKPNGKPNGNNKSENQNQNKNQNKNQNPPLSKTNTLLKLLLDQTLAAAANTLLYSVFTHSLRAAMSPAPPPVLTSPLDALRFLAGGSAYISGSGRGDKSASAIDFGSVRWERVWEAAGREFWPMLVAGMKLWPAVALVNFSLIRSVQGRNLVSGVAGLGWGVYVCLAAA